MSGLRLDCGSNIRTPTETGKTKHQLQQVFRAGAVTTWSPVPYRGQLATTKATSSSRLNPWNTGLAAYLDLALIFLLPFFKSSLIAPPSSCCNSNPCSLLWHKTHGKATEAMPALLLCRQR